MSHSIEAIARATGLAAEGDLTLAVGRTAAPAEAGPDDLAMAMDPRYAEALERSAARAAVLWRGADWRALGLEAALFAPRPRLAMAAVNALFEPPPDLAPGVHPSAVVDPSARIGADVWIGPLMVVGAGAEIGDGARILGQGTIGRGARLGARALIHPGVRIGAGVCIGARFIAQPNAVIGGDGFSFVTPEAGSAETAKEGGAVRQGQNAELRRIASLGAVTIGDDVEIGAGTTIDRGTVSDTRIGNGTKIDNLVQIGHNVAVGETCLICGQTGIGGSTRIGDRVVLGGRCGIADNVRIGSDAVLAGGTLVGANVPARTVMMGAPAQPRERFLEQVAALRRLPRVLRELRDLRAKLGL
ncbi:MAG TPA: UDP-3-O-(3-hydroxymyristoyl)glucosamine N-acyltransferase [Thermohalobaculum sp.]|nr:UDP-3-O-(3-hydroxymyristoyl)glucosamine N-acyltransferase [Thermohalobaculum sp.]